MKQQKHIIEFEGKPAFIILPYSEYQELKAAKGLNLTDEELYIKGKARIEEFFPEELVKSIIDGSNPLKAYREYRGMSQTELAKRAGLTKQYISAIERGIQKGSVKSLKAISSALKIDLELLL